jgi:hypothetical protein
VSEYVCFCQLDFADDGEPEFMVFHRGTLADCEKMYGLVPAVSYSGARPVKDARVRIMSEADLTADREAEPHG